VQPAGQLEPKAGCNGLNIFAKRLSGARVAPVEGFHRLEIKRGAVDVNICCGRAWLGWSGAAKGEEVVFSRAPPDFHAVTVWLDFHGGFDLCEAFTLVAAQCVIGVPQ
jgi:hypothetical protein